MVKRRRNKRWVYWLLFLILVVAAVIVIVLVNNNFFTSTSVENQSVLSNTTKQEEEERSNDSENKTTEETKNVEEIKEDVPQYAGDNPNKAENLTGVISYADVVGEELIIRVNINQFLATGVCKLNITKNGANVYSETANIEESVTTSTCNGFKIPMNKLASGDLQIEIDLESEGKEGKITGKVRI